MKAISLTSVLIFVFSLNAISQSSYYQNPDFNPINSAVRFLLEPPDAKATAMGETGLATAPDAASSYWNPAKYAFIGKNVLNEESDNSYYMNDLGFILSYHRMMPEIWDKYYQIYFSAYKRIDDKQVLATSFNYHTMGEITFTNNQGEPIVTHRPYDLSFDVSYSRLISENFSMATSLRYIYSNPFSTMLVSGMTVKAGNSLAADIAVYYSKPLSLKNLDKSNLSFGANISNIGSKISYFEYEWDQEEEKSFIPTNLRIGTALSLEKDVHAFEFALDLNKLLVPSSPTYVLDDDGVPVYDSNGQPIIDKGKDPDVSVGQGMIQSFYDAPNGFKEEMQEIIISTGMEYCFDNILAIRTGYHHQDKNKGYHRYLTMGAGVNYKFFEFDFSYYFPTKEYDQDNEVFNNHHRKTWYVTLLLKFNTMNHG